jgi:hypothetical protein
VVAQRFRTGNSGTFPNTSAGRLIGCDHDHGPFRIPAAQNEMKWHSERSSEEEKEPSVMQVCLGEWFGCYHSKMNYLE